MLSRKMRLRRRDADFLVSSTAIRHRAIAISAPPARREASARSDRRDDRYETACPRSWITRRRARDCSADRRHQSHRAPLMSAGTMTAVHRVGMPPGWSAARRRPQAATSARACGKTMMAGDHVLQTLGRRSGRAIRAGRKAAAAPAYRGNSRGVGAHLIGECRNSNRLHIAVFIAPSAFSLAQTMPRPAGNIRPFCEPATARSTPHSLKRKSMVDRGDPRRHRATPGARRHPHRAADWQPISLVTPVAVSLCTTITPLISCALSAQSAPRCGRDGRPCPTRRRCTIDVEAVALHLAMPRDG